MVFRILPEIVPAISDRKRQIVVGPTRRAKWSAVSCSIDLKRCMRNIGHASCKAMLHLSAGVEFDYSGARPAYKNCRLSAILADPDRCERIVLAIGIHGKTKCQVGNPCRDGAIPSLVRWFGSLSWRDRGRDRRAVRARLADEWLKKQHGVNQAMQRNRTCLNLPGFHRYM